MYREEVISVLKGIYLSITITYLYIQEIFLFLLFENKAGGLLCNMMKRYAMGNVKLDWLRNGPGEI